MEYITHDPNYNYDEAECGSMEIEEEEDGDEGDDDYSDDDDMSWKVRRAAAKTLEAVISTRPDLLPEIYVTVSPALIARFKGMTNTVMTRVFFIIKISCLSLRYIFVFKLIL